MKKDISLFDIIKRAVREKEPQFETLNNLIDEKISSAVSITFDDLATLASRDGDNFAISIEQDTEIDLNTIVFDDKKTTITIRGSGKLSNAIEDVSFPGGKEPLFKIGKGTVLILENIALKAKSFISGCVVQLNGGILVFKHSVIVNECYMGGTNQRLSDEPGFVSGKSVNSMFCDVVSGNGKGIVYDY